MKNSAPGAEKSDISGPKLGPDERNLAVFRPDLDAELRFAEGLLVVTSRRVWFRDERGRGGELLRDQPIDIERREHAGVAKVSWSGAVATRLRARATPPSWRKLWGVRPLPRAIAKTPSRMKT
jgi:hypothetical protein